MLYGKRMELGADEHGNILTRLGFSRRPHNHEVFSEPLGEHLSRVLYCTASTPIYGVVQPRGTGKTKSLYDLALTYNRFVIYIDKTTSLAPQHEFKANYCLFRHRSRSAFMEQVYTNIREVYTRFRDPICQAATLNARLCLESEVKPDTTPELHLRLILNGHADILRENFVVLSQYDDDAVRKYIKEKNSKLRPEQRPVIAYDEAGDLTRGAVELVMHT